MEVEGRIPPPPFPRQLTVCLDKLRMSVDSFYPFFSFGEKRNYRVKKLRKKSRTGTRDTVSWLRKCVLDLHFLRLLEVSKKTTVRIKLVDQSDSTEHVHGKD